jgi:DNA-binding HxlR family transcriptional regulator
MDYCKTRVKSVKDSMDLLSGKWKIQILGTLLYAGSIRFMDLQRELEGIGPKMLAKELQDLEANRLITRTPRPTRPVTVEYSLSEYGRTLEPVIEAVVAWGKHYRFAVMGQ